MESGKWLVAYFVSVSRGYAAELIRWCRWPKASVKQAEVFVVGRIGSRSFFLEFSSFFLYWVVPSWFESFSVMPTTNNLT